MDRARPRGVAGLLLAAVVAATACGGDAPRVSIDLVRASSLMPSRVFRSMTVRVRDAVSGEVVVERVVAEADIEAGAELIALDELEAGRQYVLAVSASAAVCGSGRAYGRSFPFEHRERDYRVPLQIGCGDAFSELPTAAPPGRTMASMATDGLGRALIAGGASRVIIGEGRITAEGTSADVERYDPRTGRFDRITLPHAPGIFPSLATFDDSGGAALVAGGGFLIAPCRAEAALIAQDAAAPADPLSVPRCGGASALLRRTRQVVVAGGWLGDPTDRSRDYEVYREGVLDGVIAGSAFRIRPAIVPLADGCSALVIGGTISLLPGPPFELLRAGAECGPGGAHVEPVELAPSAPALPRASWLEAAATYVACESGGGAVYVVGGREGYEPGDEVSDAVWCWRDAPGSRVEYAGRLPEPRSLTSVVTVEGRNGPRLLLFGGGGESTAAGSPPARLLDVDGCTCAPVDPLSAPMPAVPLAAPALIPAATRLGDGSVLAMGATTHADDATTGVATITAVGGATLFFADLEP